uniref:TATA-box binding protein associated factor 4b n=1 Tax=Calidris pygmaea TaxID=425635 RepID=A0A8C3JAL9_9CHAR
GQERILTSVSVLSLTCLTTVLCMCLIIYFILFKNSGTQLLKKVATTSVKPLSQTTNVVASTAQPPAVIQVGGKLYSEEMLENVKKCKNFLATLIKLASSGPQAPEMGQNVKNLVQNLLEAKIEPEEFTKKLYIELKSSPQPYLVPFLKKSMIALRQLMPNAQSFIQQSSAVATTSIPVTNPASASVTVTATPVIKPVLASVLATPSLQTVKPKPVPSSAVVTASLHPAASALTTTIATSGLATIHTVKPVFTSAVATSSLQSAKPKPLLVSTVASSAATPLQPLKPVLGTPVSIKISQPNSIVAQSVVVLAFCFLLSYVLCFVLGSILKQITLPGNKILSLQASPLQKAKIKENGATSFSRDEDDINDVTSMAEVNLNEENTCILATNSELIGTVIHSCADEPFLSSEVLQKKILNIGKRHDIMELNSDVVNLISHATQERLRGLLEKLTIIAQHRVSTHKVKEIIKYIVSSDTRAQLKFLEKLDHLEKQRKAEEEREMLLRAVKSRSSKDDPEQLQLKQKVKEMQQLELAQMQQREANLTALAAIGPRKKRPLDSSSTGSGLTKQLLCPRITRVCLRDLIFCMEQEREMKHSLTLYRALLK